MPDAVFDRLLKPPEALSALGISPRTLTRYVSKGYLTKVKLGTQNRFKASEVADLVEHGTDGLPGRRAA